MKLTKNSRLKLAIFEAGVTQQELARKSRLPRTYISMAINGRLNLDGHQQRRLANTLGRPIAELFGKQDPE